MKIALTLYYVYTYYNLILKYFLNAKKGYIYYIKLKTIIMIVKLSENNEVSNKSK